MWLWEEIIQFDEPIFQTGWNHQLATSLLRMQLAKTNFDFVTTAIFSALETQNAEQQKAASRPKSVVFFGGILDFSFGREVTTRKMFMYNQKWELSRY